MTSKKVKKWDFFSKMRKQSMHILQDVIYLYRNFIHWNVSKIFISFWSMLLGFIIAAPMFLLAVIIWFIDPIDWKELISFIISWSDISYNIIWEIATHAYWLIGMIFLVVVWVFLFLLASSYSLLLEANLSLHYLKEKQLKYKKNLYTSREHIVTFMSIICWNIMYLLAPVIIWVWVVFFMYLFFNVWFISLNGLSVLIAAATIILFFAIVYLIYRIIFGYVLLARDNKKKKLHSWKEYVQESIEITGGSNFFKFLFITIIYSLLLFPFTTFDSYLERESLYLKDTMVYNSGLVDNLEPEQIQYYEYITAEYSDLSDDQILSRIQSYFTLRIILFFLSYLIFSGLFVYVITSFYTRVLSKK
jgi:hypothetical protein